MKNLLEIKAIVRGYLDISDAEVDQPILDSVNFLSNIFAIQLIDESQSTVVDEDTLNLPNESSEIETVFLNGEEIRPLKKLSDLETVRESGEQRWYEFNDKIQFTNVFTTIVTSKIWYKKGYKEPEDAVDTDVPQKLLELVYVGAQHRYFNILITQVSTRKDVMPDVKASDLRLIRDDLKKQYFELIKVIQMNG